MLIVPSHVEQLGSQVDQTPETATSFVLVQEASQVFEVVTTFVPVQEVQVVVEISQVLQVESQASQVEPDSIVFPDSQVAWQVSSLRSSF